MNERLYRSVDDRVIAGVCGGLAARLALDPSLVRVLWAVIALLTGIFPLLVIYVVMANKTPRKDIEKAIDNLGRDKILGIVFNGYEQVRKSYYRYYNRYYKGNNKR